MIGRLTNTSDKTVVQARMKLNKCENTSNGGERGMGNATQSKHEENPLEKST